MPRTGSSIGDEDADFADEHDSASHAAEMAGGPEGEPEEDTPRGLAAPTDLSVAWRPIGRRRRRRVHRWPAAGRRQWSGMTHQVEVNGMARERDVVDLLLEQHGRIETLFDQVAVARG